MMRAASSGHAAVQDARSQVLAQHRAGAQQADQRAGMVGGIVQEHEQFGEQMEQRRSETELRAAEAGFEPNTPGGGGDRTPGGDRLARLDQEMQRGADQPQVGPLETEAQNRLRLQGAQPMEQDPGSGRWRPNAERRQQTAARQELEAHKAITERVKAEAYRDQVGLTAQKQLAAGDEKAYQEIAKSLASHANGFQKRYDRIIKSGGDQEDWREMHDAILNDPSADPELKSAIEAQEMTPRVQQFLRAQVAREALKSVVRSKGSMQHLEVDETSVPFQQFYSKRDEINSFLRSNPLFGQMASKFITNSQQKMRLVNSLAATAILMGMGNAPAGPTGQQDLVPSTEPPPPSPEEQQAADDQTVTGQLFGGGLGRRFAEDFAEPGAGGQATQGAVGEIERRRAAGASPAQSREGHPPVDTPDWRERFGRR